MSIPAVVEKVLKESVHPSLTIRAGRALGGGCINHAMKIETSHGDFFVKYNAHAASDLFLREAECLEELSKSGTSLVVPRVVAATAVQDGTPAVLITEYLAPPHSTADYDERLGRGLAELHRFTAESFGFHHHNYCGSTPQDNTWNKDWAGFFGEQRIWKLVKRIAGKGDYRSGEIKTFETLVERLPRLIGHKPIPSLIHGDLWSGNYMPSARGPAIIDPASWYADRECEFSIMNMFGGFSSKVFQAYNEAYPLPPEWKQRNDLYMLYHYLNHYYLFGGGYGGQALAIAKKYC